MKREEFIKGLIYAKDYKVIAEIGVLRGAFTNHLNSTNPDELILIDPWKCWSTDVYGDYPTYMQKDWDLLFEKVSRRYNQNHVRILRMTSEEAANQFPDGHFDLVYIDGNHEHDFVLADLHNWKPKIRKGGTICGHDYQITHKAVKSFCEAYGLSINHITDEKSTASYFIQL